ncbi:hypothetical protein ACIQM4_11725 [Streptomyces sp. NPDC091272]|uniref:hypothetical protein n=1 Tax=Streptomyces sp. NPDC091272 TaxID=3365981 RepID=UPI003802387F
MTSMTGTAQHPDVAEIADLAEGLLSPSRTEDVRQHVDGCALCADVQRSLEEIRGLLGTLPGPQRMPADIAGRIDAALAAEALLDSTAPDSATDSAAPASAASAAEAPGSSAVAGTAHGDGRRAHGADEPADVSRETSSAPSRRRSVERPAAPQRAGRAPATTGPGRPGSRKPRRRAVWSAVLGVATLGLAVLLVQSFQSFRSAPHHSGKDAASAAQIQQFSGAPLQNHVQNLLGATRHESLRTPKDKNAPSVDIQESPNSTKQALGVPSCIQRGTGRPDTPLGTEQGMYEGKQAFLVLLPHPSDSTMVQAYVIDAACVDATPAGKGELLLTHAYPRH